MLAIKTILHPSDFSERSERALRVACSLAADYEAHLVVIHVVSRPPFFNEGLLLPSMYQELQRTSPRMEVFSAAENGRAAGEILRVARVCHADLIVMAAHAGRAMSGSILEDVVRRAACPVLTITSPTATEPATLLQRICREGDAPAEP